MKISDNDIDIIDFYLKNIELAIRFEIPIVPNDCYHKMIKDCIRKLNSDSSSSSSRSNDHVTETEFVGNKRITKIVNGS